TAHRYRPFDVECGVVAFPFYCGCMTDGGERVAYCGLRFGEERAEKWKLLGLESALGLLNVDATAAGVSITSGVCCIADSEAYVDYCKHLQDEVHPLAGLIVLNGQTHEQVELYGNKYAVFSTGWGDGKYNCYAGFTADGRLTAIVADFGMIEYPMGDDELEEVEVEADAVDLYVYDPSKSESENNIARWTLALENASDPIMRLRAYSRRGYAYHSAKNSDAALADYISAVECSKQVTDRGELSRAWSVYDNAAEIYCQRSDYESAIRLMTDALEVNDSLYSGAFVRLIDLYRLTKRADKAMEIAERMLERRPNDPVASMKYAECCVSVAEYKAAADMYERLATKFMLYENLFDEASCLIELGDYEQASSALERHPAKEHYEQYWYYKAYIDYKKRDFRAALDNAEISHELDKEYMPALYLLIDIESLLQEYHAVARYAEEYKRLRPDNEYGYNVCAEAHLMLGNFSECARNYCYLYDSIKQDDKYAALAALACSKSGDKKRRTEMMRVLKRKRSPYYYGTMYGVYISKYRELDNALDKVVYNLHSDKDFILLLAVYLLQINVILPATHLIGELTKDNYRSFEVVAQQIRIAEKIGDKKQFLSFLDYYAEHYIAADMPAQDKRIIAERFMSANGKRRGWLSEVK
ncbi:MAG: tetratricopeptide repeat protein, partial [Clostridiales bacterium]|nr:tetratricopeptide repeat protein [Clostridiales bacterium]